MKKMTKKFKSMIIMSYAFTALNATAYSALSETEIKDISKSGFNINNEFDTIKSIKDDSILSSKIDNGSELTWASLNNVQIYGDDKPLGFNNRGLIVKSISNEKNTYNDSENNDISISSKDFPSWILSKYANIDDVKDAVRNISLVKNNGDKSLSYEITDKNKGKVILNVVNGDITTS